MDLKKAKIERRFIKDEAYDIISSQIISGDLKPKTRLRINELSEDLGISRTPVREALLKLEDEGLVMTKANRWTIVAPIDLKETLDIYPIISNLEALALRLAFDNIDEKIIEKLEKINRKIKLSTEDNDQEAMFELDAKFHKIIIDLSQNTEIYPILEGLKRRVKRVEIFFFENENDKLTTFEEHEKIIENLKKKDLEKSIKALRKNWANTLSALAGFEDKYDGLEDLGL